MSTEDKLKNVSPTIGNTVLAADADYWLTASTEEVKKYLLENTDMKEYEFKKQQLLCKIQEKLKSK